MDRAPDDRLGVPVRAVRSAMVRPEAWTVGVGLGVVVAARWAALDAASARAVLVGGVAVVTIALLVGVSVEHDRPVVAAAVLLACSPTVLVAAADGRWQGALAVVSVALAVASEWRPARVALSLVAVAGLVQWWRAGFDRGAAPGPAWREIAGSTGAVVRRTVGSVGTEELLVPLSGALTWWVGVGIVIGVALVDQRVWRAAWTPAALALLVAGIWAIRTWRGAVDPVAGTWIVATAIVLTVAGRGGRAGRDPGAEARFAAALAAVAGFTLAVAVVQELRGHGAAAVAAGFGAATAGLGVVTADGVRRVSARSGA